MPALYVACQASRPREPTDERLARQLILDSESGQPGHAQVKVKVAVDGESSDGHNGEVLGKGCLDFIHIPKAAGSSVEKASFAALGAHSGGSVDGWGKEDGQLECSHPSSDEVGTFCNIYSSGRIVGRTYIWHTPPSWDSKLKHSYTRCTTFCVVRDPVERAVSEWTYLGGCDGKQGEVNEFIWNNLEKAALNPFHGSGHWLPQAEYVYGHATAVYGERSPKGEYCQRVLRFENLTAEFNSLMKEFEFDATLERRNPSKKCPDKAVTE